MPDSPKLLLFAIVFSDTLHFENMKMKSLWSEVLYLRQHIFSMETLSEQFAPFKKKETAASASERILENSKLLEIYC